MPVNEVQRLLNSEEGVMKRGRIKKSRVSAVAVSLVVFFSVLANAQDEFELEQRGLSEESLAKQAQNPVGALISLPFQNNTNFDVGPRDRTQNVLNIQPVWPLSVSKGWNLITRTILPVISQPAPGADRTNGLGDINFTAFLSPREPGKLIWGAGPIFVFPSATDEVLGTDKWSLGPSFVALVMPGPWVLGALVNNVWSIAGDSDAPDVNSMLFQYFINYNYPNGFYWTSAPIITANWEASSGNQWTIPFGGGAGKLFKIGKRPVNASVSAFYNVEKPEFAGDWTLRLQVQLLFPK
jgi:hypothetical protein